MRTEGRHLGLLVLAVAAVVVIAAGSTVAPANSGAQAGSMHNCPPPGKWSIAVWAGAGDTSADHALGSCGVDAVAAAYSLDAQTGAWSRWFAGKPAVSNLPPLGEMQGVLALGGTAAASAGDTLTAAQTESDMQNCPPAGKWSIAVWSGPDGAVATDALAACQEADVAAAYSLDSQTGAWARWFAGKPDVSNLAPLGEMQGILALGAAAASPSPTPAATPAPTPGGPAAPVAGAMYAGQTSEGLVLEFDVASDGLGIDRVKFGFTGVLNGTPCEGFMNTTFGRAEVIVDSAFTINDSDYTMTGRFNSATTAVGELHVHIPDRWADPGCFGNPQTWTASVQ